MHLREVVPPQIAATDAAWLAGLFDGEGSVGLSFRRYKGKTGKGAWTIRLNICNTHGPTIQRVRDIVGFGDGQIRVPADRPHKRPVFAWVAESLAAETFLKLMEPYSVTKAEQIASALAARDLWRRAPRLKRGRGNGRGAPTITEATHDARRAHAQRIKDLNGHKPIAEACGGE
jgi:hypothetical protein